MGDDDALETAARTLCGHHRRAVRPRRTTPHFLLGLRTPAHSQMLEHSERRLLQCTLFRLCRFAEFAERRILKVRQNVSDAAAVEALSAHRPFTVHEVDVEPQSQRRRQTAARKQLGALLYGAAQMKE